MLKIMSFILDLSTVLARKIFFEGAFLDQVGYTKEDLGNFEG